MEGVEERKFKIRTNKNNEMELLLKNIIMKNYQLLYLIIMKKYLKNMNLNVI